MMRGASTTSPGLLEAILQKLERGGSPDSRFPDRKGEYWALCPFHPDKHPRNFSVSEAGYKCFACGASGGLRALARRLGVAPHSACPAWLRQSGAFREEKRLRPRTGIFEGAPRRDTSGTSEMAGGVAPHAASRDKRLLCGAPRADTSRAGGMAGGVARLQLHQGGNDTFSFPATLENYAQVKHLPIDFLESLGLATVRIRGHLAVKMPYFDSDGTKIGARLRVALGGTNRFKWRTGTRVHPYGLWR